MNKDRLLFFLRKWQKDLGLLDYEIFLKEKEIDAEGIRASVSVDYYGKVVSVFYNPDWLKTADVKEMERVMFHECMEILLTPIDIDLQLTYSKAHVELRCHEVIRVFENVIFGQEV